MAYLVLGAGYIGSELVRQLLGRGEKVVAFDNFFSTDEQDLDCLAGDSNFELVRGSITSSTDLAHAFGAADPVEVVFNLSAQASGNPAAAPPEYTEEANLRGPRHVCEAARKFGASRLVYASSTRVYGDPLPNVVTEKTPYGSFADLSHLSKCYAEKLLEMYCADRELTGVSLRLGLVFGVSPVMKSDYRFMTAPNKFALQAVRGEKLSVNSNNWVGAVHVADAAAGLIYLAGLPGEPGYRVFNLAPIIVRIDEIARLVAREAGNRGAPTIVVPEDSLTAPTDKPRISSELIKRGFEPRWTLDAGVSETYRYFAARQSN